MKEDDPTLPMTRIMAAPERKYYVAVNGGLYEGKLKNTGVWQSSSNLFAHTEKLVYLRPNLTSSAVSHYDFLCTHSWDDPRKSSHPRSPTSTAHYYCLLIAFQDGQNQHSTSSQHSAQIGGKSNGGR